MGVRRRVIETNTGFNRSCASSIRVVWLLTDSGKTHQSDSEERGHGFVQFYDRLETFFRQLTDKSSHGGANVSINGNRNGQHLDLCSRFCGCSLFSASISLSFSVRYLFFTARKYFELSSPQMSQNDRFLLEKTCNDYTCNQKR